MPKTYATTDDGHRFLYEFECERCDATVKPHAEIAQSGWTKHGYLDAFDEAHEEYYCPDHEPEYDKGLGSVIRDRMMRRLVDFERFKRKMMKR